MINLLMKNKIKRIVPSGIIKLNKRCFLINLARINMFDRILMNKIICNLQSVASQPKWKADRSPHYPLIIYSLRKVKNIIKHIRPEQIKNLRTFHNIFQEKTQIINMQIMQIKFLNK